MSTEPLTCPKCQKPSMVEMKTPDHVALDFCENCNGLWFDQSELADYLGLSKDLTHFDAVKDQAKPTGLQCPKCPSSLVEMPFSTLSPASDVPLKPCSGENTFTISIPKLSKLSTRWVFLIIEV